MLFVFIDGDEKKKEEEEKEENDIEWKNRIIISAIQR
jgi:hypothetical protein